MQEKSSNDQSIDVESGHPGQNPGVTQKRSHRFGKFLRLLLCLIILGLILAIGVNMFGITHDMKQLQGDIRVLFDSQVKSGLIAGQRLSELSQSLGDQQKKLSDTQLQLKDFMNRTPLDEIRALTLGEIAYTLQIAQIELSVKHNIPSALVLLKQVEAQTDKLSSSSSAIAGKLGNFQETLLKDIGILQSVSIVDRENLSDRLDHLKDSVPDLSILVSPKPNTSLVESTPRQEHKHWYQRAWDNMKASFNALIIIRHQEDKIPPLLSPEEKIFLQENLQLLLMRAQWSLMNHEPSLYEKNLKQAKSWVEKYYVQNSLLTLSFLKEIDFLSHQNISPTVPDLSPLLAALPKEI